MSSEFQTEAAFRRGFHQGYEQALAHLVRRETHGDMLAYAEAVQEWRERSTRNGEGFVPPPEMGTMVLRRSISSTSHRQK